MSIMAIPLILSVALFVSVLCASLPQEEQEPIASEEVPRLTGDRFWGLRVVEATRKPVDLWSELRFGRWEFHWPVGRSMSRELCTANA